MRGPRPSSLAILGVLLVAIMAASPGLLHHAALPSSAPTIPAPAPATAIAPSAASADRSAADPDRPMAGANLPGFGVGPPPPRVLGWNEDLSAGPSANLYGHATAYNPADAYVVSFGGMKPGYVGSGPMVNET